MRVHIWTAGDCVEGYGGWACVLQAHKVMTLKGEEGHKIATTLMRMKLVAAYKGLEALKRPSHVKLYSDSALIAEAMTRGWVEKWRRNHWRDSRDRPILHVTLWEILEEAAKPHTVEWFARSEPKEVDEEGANRASGLASAAARMCQLGEESLKTQKSS